MHIHSIQRVENYRNLSHQTMYFDADINFIIGENNIGKTNTIELFNALLNTKKFKKSDFYDIHKPIEIEIEVETEDGIKSMIGIQKDIHSSISFIDPDHLLDKMNVFYLHSFQTLNEEQSIQSILSQLHDYIQTRKEENYIVQEGKKILPLFLLMDEPENHLHPYRQRSLIKKVSTILKDHDYVGMGQMFIVTHSPNILLQNYKQFIRIYQEQEMKVVSGASIHLENTELYKHMLHNFVYLKEAMFSKIIIFVEGDTENGALPIFAKRMDIDLDEKGIGVVKLDGAESVLRCMHLYKKFGIPSVAIIDSDKKEKYEGYENIYFTEGIDFEEDIYTHFTLEDYIQCLDQLGGSDYFKDMIHNQDPTIVLEKYKPSQLRYLRGKKNALKGSILASYVTNIPPCYKDIIELALENRE